eukprot:759436-Hanusia_phi.AAC.5
MNIPEVRKPSFIVVPYRSNHNWNGKMAANLDASHSLALYSFLQLSQVYSFYPHPRRTFLVKTKIRAIQRGWLISVLGTSCFLGLRPFWSTHILTCYSAPPHSLVPLILDINLP